MVCLMLDALAGQVILSTEGDISTHGCEWQWCERPSQVHVSSLDALAGQGILSIEGVTRTDGCEWRWCARVGAARKEQPAADGFQAAGIRCGKGQGRFAC